MRDEEAIVVDSGQVGPVPGSSGRPETAGEPAGSGYGSGSAGEPAGSGYGSGGAGEPSLEGERSGLTEVGELAGLSELELSALAGEPCAVAELSGVADEPCPAEEASRAGGGGTSCRAREVLQRVGDKWSVQVIDLLRQDTLRFTELHRSINGITARMLTVTLRGLERDGIVTRTIHPVIPPRVDYALTPLGCTLLVTIGQLVTWADSHLDEIETARAAYDAKHQPH